MFRLAFFVLLFVSAAVGLDLPAKAADCDLAAMQTQLTTLNGQRQTLINEITRLEGQIAGAEMDGSDEARRQLQALQLVFEGTKQELATIEKKIRAVLSTIARCADERDFAQPVNGASLGEQRTFLSFGDQDIMALAFIVMAESAKSAREDLKAIMDGLKSAGKSNAQLRPFLDLDGYTQQQISHRYGQSIAGDGSLFGAMVAFSKLINGEMRQDRQTSRGKLRGSMLEMLKDATPEQSDLILRLMIDWVRRIRTDLAGIGDSELRAVNLQRLAGQRQHAIALASNLISALDSTAKKIAGNLDVGISVLEPVTNDNTCRHNCDGSSD